MLDFVLSNSTWGDGELIVEFRQPFDLIAVGATELKQKKAAGMGSDDLYQFKYTLGQSKPQDWQSLHATELADRWTIKGDLRRQDNSWILGGKEESVARCDVAARPLVVLCANLQCKKSTAPFSQPRITVWVRDRASGRVQQSSFSLPEGSANTDRQQVCILARYDMETRRMCTAQWSGETDRSAGNFSQPPGDIVAIGFHVPEGSQLKVHRLQLRRLGVVGKEDVPVRSE